MRYFRSFSARLNLAVVFAIWLLTAHSQAHAFFAQTYGDFGDVAVVLVQGDYDQPTLDCDVCRIPRRVIAQEFYKTHPDKYDFVVVFSNFDFLMPEDIVDGQTYKAAGFFTNVSNSVEGIGIPVFDNTDLYGSKGRLKGYIDMGYLGKKATNPLDPAFTDTMTTLSHELLHNWGAHVRYRDESGNTSGALIGLQGAHWSYLLDTDGSLMYGNNWRMNGNGTFTALSGDKYYSRLDLYLMGMADRSEVPPLRLIENSTINKDKLPENGVTIEGVLKTVSIDDIIAVEGERSPSVSQSQKEFNIASILIVRPDTFDENQVYQVRSVMENWVMWFSALTDGRARVIPESSAIVQIPQNPGIDPPPHNPRTLPPEIQDGVSWLMANQQEEGNWTDTPYTRHRDTVQAVLALSHFPTGSQNVARALEWLGTEAFSSTDELAGKILADSENGMDGEKSRADLLACRNLDGGWGANGNYISNPLDTSCALAALSMAGLSDSLVISSGIDYLKAHQNSDNGWGSGQDTSDILATVNVLSAFISYSDSYDLAQYMDKGVAWLRQRQNPDGGFGNSPSTVYDTAMALMLFSRMDTSSATVENALDYLLSMQSENGSWHESACQTALSVSAIWAARQQPDLKVETGNITFQPASISALPAEVTISAVIHNSGLMDVQEARVSLYKGAIAEENAIAHHVISLAGQSSTTLTFTDTVTQGTPQYYYIFADSDNQVAEASETNNRALRIMQADATCDFEIVDADVTVVPDAAEMMQTVTVAASIRNRGAADAYGVPVKFYVNGSEFAQTSVDLPAGGTVTKEVTWKVDRSGSLNITVTADPDDLFAGEISESNNTGYAVLIVDTPTKPNIALSHQNLSVTPTPLLEGGAARIGMLVENNGFGSIGNIDVRFYLGEPQQGTLIGSSFISTLAAGESQSVEIDWADIDIYGDRLISVEAYSPDGTEEVSLSDNTAFASVRILGLPDLFVSPTTVMAEPSMAAEGDTVHISVTVMNKGEQETAGVEVTVSESDQTIFTGLIETIPANSQATVTFSYDTAGKPGPHQVQAAADPQNLIVEKDENNNTASRSFAVQTGTTWLTEAYISPNGDETKDETRFFFTLNEPATVLVEIVNKKDEVVRTFSGDGFINCTGGGITWDGRDDSGQVVPDGRYRIQVKDENGQVLTGAYVVVDNNRSQLSEAIGTDYFFQKNITCPIPGIRIFDNDYVDGDGVWDLEWFSDESSMLVLVSDWRNASFEYPEGLYTISPDGSDIKPLVPQDIGSWDYTGYWGKAFDLSNDEESIVFKVQVYDQIIEKFLYQIWTVDRFGQNLFHVTGSLPELPSEVHDLTFSPNHSKISYYSAKGLYVINADGTVHTKLASTQTYIEKHWWSPDSSRIAYIDGYYGDYYKAPKLRITDMDGNIQIFNQFHEIREIEWINPGKLVVVEKDADSSGYYPEIFNVWLIDVIEGHEPVRLSSNIYNQSYWDSFYVTYWNNISPSHYETRNIITIQENNTFAYIDNSGKNFELRLCDDRGNCRVLHESPKVNQGIGCYGDDYQCYDSYVSMNDLSLSPDGKKLAFVDYAYKPVSGEIVSESWEDPCSYEVYLIVVDLITGEKKAYPFDEFNSCHSFHIYVQNNGSWIEEGVLHYGRKFSEKRMDLFKVYNAKDNTYKLKIEQIGEKSAEIQSIKLIIDEQYYLPSSIINIDKGEELINSGIIDAYSKTFIVTWEGVPAIAQAVFEFSMSAKEENYFYENGSLHWLGNNALTARDRTDYIYGGRGRVKIVDIDNGKIDSIPMRENNCRVMDGSPQGNYVIYEDEYCSGGFQYGGGIWALSSMMNLTAELHTRRKDSYIVLEGTAMDLNFDRYVLEYADVNSTEVWNLITPPSEKPVKSEIFMNWVPPGEGTYHVRLTAYDKAGNRAVKRTRISWGASTAVSSLYKTGVAYSGDDPVFEGTGEIFSPYTDSRNQAVALHYRVLAPIHLEFSVTDASGNQLTSFAKSYATVPSGGMTDHIIWDGRDSSGNIVADGVYTIEVMDYQFRFEVDRTPPAVGIDLSAIHLGLLDEVSAYGRGTGLKVELAGSASDLNLKSWRIDYGTGTNPAEWISYASGVETPIEPFVFRAGDISFAVGRKFKITAEDAAGNISTRVSGMLEEKLVLQSWEIPAGAIASTGSSLSATDQTGDWFNIGLTRDEGDNIIPTEYIPEPYLAPGIHRIKGLETLGSSFVSAVVQYCGINMVWIDAAEITDLPSGPFEFEFDNTGIDMEAVYAIRLKIIDESGIPHFSNPLPVRPMLVIKVDNVTCQLGYIKMIHEPLKKLKFQWAPAGSKSSAVYNWQDYWVYDTASGDVIPNGFNQVMPEPPAVSGKYYVLRILGVGEGGNSYPSDYVLYPVTCSGDDKPWSFDVDIEYAHQGCDTPYSSASVVPDYGDGGSPYGYKQATYTLLNSSGEEVDTIGYTTSPYDSVNLDLTTLSPGVWLIKADLETISGNMSASRTLIVDDLLPEAEITYPSGSDKICPVQSTDKSGNDICVIDVEGVAADNRGIKKYELYYGMGETPSAWKMVNNAIETSANVRGRLVQWDVTGLSSGTYALKLSVYDAYGNTTCCVTPAFYLDKGPEWNISGAGRKLFSPNGDGIADEVSFTYTLNEPATIGADLMQDENIVKTILAPQLLQAGSETLVVDNPALADGLYDIRVFIEDSCGHKGEKRINDIEVDKTPPDVLITSPHAGDPMGIIVEITGSAADRNFFRYRLKAESSDVPDQTVLLRESSQQIVEGVLGSWNTFGLSGTWVITLAADDKVGNAREASVTIDLGDRQQFIRDLFPTRNLFSPNSDGVLDHTEIRFDLNPDIMETYDVVIEIRAADNTVKKTYSLSSVPGGTHTWTWQGESQTAGEDIVPDGRYQVVLKAALSSSPGVTQTETLTIEVDTLPPSLSLTSPLADAYIKNDLEIKGSVSDGNLISYQIDCTNAAGSIFSDSGDQGRTNHRFAYLTDLPDGPCDLLFTARDAAGNRSEERIRFTVDRTPPEVLLSAPANNSLYGFTNNRVEISGTIADDNLQSWRLVYGAGAGPSEWTDLASGDAMPGSPITYEWSVGEDQSISDGVYTLLLNAVDRAGSSVERRTAIHVDNTPPVVEIQAPADGQRVKSLEMKGSISDQHLKSYVVELSENDCASGGNWNRVAAGDAPVQNGIIASLNNLKDGTYCVRVTAEDQLGQSATALRRIIVDAAPPASPVLSGELKNRTECHLNWTQNTESDFAGYYLYRNGSKINSNLITETAYIDTVQAEGVFSYTVTALDQAGLESPASNRIELRVDMTGPTAKISYPRDGSVVPDLIDIKGTAYSADDFKEYRVYWAQGNPPAGWTLIRKSPVPVSYGVLAQNDVLLSHGGSYAIRLEAEDQQGNINTDEVIFRVDNQPPAVPVLVSAVPSGSQVNLTWQANSEPDLAGYLVYRDERLVNSSDMPDDIMPYLVRATAYADKNRPEGSYRYHICAVDLAGNVSAESNAITAVVDLSPAIKITSPANSYYGYQFEFSVDIVAETSALDVAEVRFEYRKASMSTWYNIGDPLTGEPWTARFDPKTLALPYADYYLRAMARDLNGNIGYSSVVKVIYLNMAPAKPTGLSAAVNEGEVTLTWNPNTEGDLKGYNVYRMSGGSAYKLNAVPITDPSFVISGLSDAVYTYAAEAVDLGGKTSGRTASVTAYVYTAQINSVPSAVPDPNLTISGWADTDAVVEIFNNGISSTALHADARYFTGELSLNAGENRLTAKATDPKGNISKTSPPVVVVYDEPPPAPTGLAAAVSGYDCLLTWDPVPVPDLSHYNLYRNGEKLNTGSVIASGTASASVNCTSACLAFDQSLATGWASFGFIFPPIPEGCDPGTQKCSPDTGCTISPNCEMPPPEEGIWWQIDLPAPEQISQIEIEWDRSHIAPIYGVQLWTGEGWGPGFVYSGNEYYISRIVFESPVMTERIRIVFFETSSENYAVINDMRIQTGGKITGTSFLDSGLSDGRYEYHMTAVDIYGLESPLSDPAYADIGDVTPPGQPQNLAASVVGMDVTLTWDMVDDPELAGYNVYKDTPNGWTRLNPQILPQTGFAETVINNGEYRYRVTAVDAAGNESEPSETATALVDSDILPRPTVKTIKTAPEGDAVYICWELTGWPDAGFHLYRSHAPGGPFERINADIIEQSCYLDKDVTAGQSCYYKVSALDGLGFEGAASDPVNVVPENRLPLLKPVFLEPTVSGSPVISMEPSVVIAGSANPGTTVELYRNDDYKGSAVAVPNPSPLSYQILLYSNRLKNPEVSPDERHVAYLKYYPYASPVVYALECMDLHTGEISPIADDVVDFDWSPDGKSIAYTANRMNNGAPIRRTFIFDSAGNTHTSFDEENTAGQYSPSWSEDGKRIIFVRESETGATSIWLKDIASGILNPVVGDGEPGVVLQAPSFSPDNLHVSYIQSSTAGNELHLVDMNTGDDVCVNAKISYSEKSASWYRWSPDGTGIAYFANINFMNNIEVYDPAARSIRQVTSSDSYVNGYDWSYDGMRIIYLDSANDIRIAPVDIPGCDKLLLSSGNYQEYFAAGGSGAVWYGRYDYPNFTLNRWDEGRFEFPDIELSGGDNEFYAISVNASGVFSPWSDPITVTVEQGPLPDLSVDSTDIHFYPAAPLSGDKVAGSIIVKNNGDAAAENVMVEIYIIDLQGNRQTISSENLVRLDPSTAITYDFTWDTTGKTGLYRIRAKVDPLSLVVETSEQNNTAEAEIYVAETAGLSFTAALDSDAYPADAEVGILVRLFNNGPDTSACLDVRIEDDQGNLTDTISDQDLFISYGDNRELLYSWNTGSIYAGQYNVKVILSHDNGETIKELALPFTVMADNNITARLTTDKQSYGPGEDVRFTLRVENKSRNSYAGPVRASFEITDGQANKIFAAELDMGSLFPGTFASWPVIWNTALNEAGTFAAAMNILVGETPVSSASLQFEVKPQIKITANLTLPESGIGPGEDVHIAYHLKNGGNVLIENLPLNLVLADSKNGIEDVVAQALLENLALSEERTGTLEFSTNGYGIRSYVLLLKALTNEQWTTLASALLSVTDTAPPEITILSPQNDGIYHCRFNLSVEAKDLHSNVDRVEYRMDQDPWTPLLLADPAKNRYAIPFTPSGESMGSHVFAFRACDAPGNLSPAVSATVHIAAKMEVSAAIGKSEYGINEEIPIDIRLQNTGWAKAVTLEMVIETMTAETVDSLNPVQATVTSDGVYTTTRTWNTGIHPPGDCRARIMVKYGETVLDEASVQFVIQPVLSLAGALSFTPAEVTCGGIVQADGMVENRGNITADDVLIRLLLKDPENNDEQTIIYDTETTVGIGDILPITHLIDTGTLFPKTYSVSLLHITGEISEQLAEAEFTVTDGMAPVVTILSPAEGGVYDGPFDLTVTAIDDASGVEKVEYRFGTGPWQPLPASSDDPDIFTGTYIPVEADEGMRTIDFHAYDRAGNESTTVSVAITIELFKEFKSLTGTLMVSPDPVLQGEDESYAFTITNDQANDVAALIVYVRISAVDTGEILKTLEKAAAAPGASTYAGNIVDPVDLDAGNYGAELWVAIDAPVVERCLAIDEFAVAERPVVTLEKTIANDIRLLVWLNDNCRLEVNDDPDSSDWVWKDCIREDLLKQILSAYVSDFVIVADQEEFIRELRNPYYTDILVLGDQKQIGDSVCYEFVERVISGTGIISARWISRVFSLKYNDIFGVKAAGSLSGDPIIRTLDGPITDAGIFNAAGPVITVEPISQGAIIAGWVESGKTGKGPYPAIVLNDFGAGRSVYFAFDLGMTISDQNVNWIETLLERTFAYISGKKGFPAIHPWQVAPLQVSIKSTITDYDYLLIEQFDENLLFYDRQYRRWIGGSPQTFDIVLTPDEETLRRFYYLTPDITGCFPTRTRAGILFNGEYVSLNDAALDICVESDRNGLIDHLISGLNALPAGGKEREAVLDSLNYLEVVKVRPVNFREDVAMNINDIMSAVHHVLKIESTDTSDLRQDLDALLRVEAGRYYLFDAEAEN